MGDAAMDKPYRAMRPHQQYGNEETREKRPLSTGQYVNVNWMLGREDVGHSIASISQ